MADEYKILTQDARDEIVVEFLEAQERDLFCHRINLERYDGMIKDLPEGKWKKRVTELRAETVERIAEVSSIIKGTVTQLPSAERITAAKTRLVEKSKTNVK